MELGACKFCGLVFDKKLASSAELLDIHLLDAHPLELHFLRARRDQTPPRETVSRRVLKAEVIKQELVTPPKLAVPSRRRHHSPSAQEPLYSSLLEARRAMAARRGFQPKHKPTHHSPVMGPKPSRQRSPSPPPQKRRRPDPPLPPSALRCKPHGVAARRCHHNERRCLHFPDCRGRACPRLHPMCLLGNTCLQLNTCPFEHVELEKTCEVCVERISPTAAPPVIRHCPHRKVIYCRKNRELKGHCKYGGHCTFLHGQCPNGSKCVAVKCYFEHPDVIYFCDKCSQAAESFISFNTN